MTSIHTCRSYVHTPRDVLRTAWSHQLENFFVFSFFTRSPIRSISGFWGAKLAKVGDSLPCMHNAAMQLVEQSLPVYTRVD